MQRILAFDFGLLETGVAFAQFITGDARGVRTLRCADGQPVWREVKALVADYNPQILVVGLPLNMDGSESDMCARARDFAERLGAKTQLDVCLQDERLTSRIAAAELEAARALGRAKTDHELAACYIAEDFLAMRVD